MKYLSGLTDCIRKYGGRILTAHVKSVNDGEPVCIETADGTTVRAKYAVVATNSPINDGVMIHTKQAPYRTYVVAASVPINSVPDILCWDTETPYHYVRLQRAAETDVLIVGGEDHKTGQANDGAARFGRLEAWARARFPMITTFMDHWSGQVMESADYLGYMGRNPGDENIFIITGDSGMGMSHGTIGGMICADLIQGRQNRWAKLFDPSRVSPKAAGRFARENLNAAAQLREYLTPGDVQDAAHIRPGGGAVIRRGASKYAVYRRADGSLVERSAVCPHMGCIVAWNAVESCWDCPCHGSQFGAEGEVINGPATGGLSTPEQRTQSAPVHKDSHTYR